MAVLRVRLYRKKSNIIHATRTDSPVIKIDPRRFALLISFLTTKLFIAARLNCFRNRLIRFVIRGLITN